MSEKKEKIKNGISKVRTSFKDYSDNIKNGGKHLVITVIICFILMIIACLAVFFLSVQGAEKVMMPNVKEKPLTSALLEMQAKKLYPNIQLRYSDVPGSAGKVIEQNPEAGAIIKAYHEVTLTVSRGAFIDEIEDYTGMNYNDVLQRMQVLYAGEEALVKVTAPVYKKSDAKEGTIIAQYPEAGTEIENEVKLTCVISSGNSEKTVNVPNFKGLTIQKALDEISKTALTVDFTTHTAKSGEKAGTITSQSIAAKSEVNAYTRLTADIALPSSADENTSYGVVSFTLPEYPFPVPVKLEAQSPEGKVSTLAEFNHPGTDISIAYAVPHGSVLTLYALDEEVLQEQTH